MNVYNLKSVHANRQNYELQNFQFVTGYENQQTGTRFKLGSKQKYVKYVVNL